MNVEVTWRPGRPRRSMALAIPALVAVCGAWLVRHHGFGVVLLAGAVVTAGVELLDRGGRAARQLVLRDERLYVDGHPFELRNAWVAPAWLVLRGRSGGRRDRLAIQRGELSDVEFCRLRRFCIRNLPRINRPRFAPRRAHR